MLRNHFKIAWRVFSKRKLYGAINLAGLSIAMAFCLLVSLYVKDEFRYGGFHEKGDRLFLLHSISFKSDDLQIEPNIFDTKPNPNIRKSVPETHSFISLIKERIPEITSLVKVDWGSVSIKKEGKLLTERARYVDPSFFEAFTFNFLYGSPETALDGLKDLVITEEIAMKHLGRLDVVGETIQLGGDKDDVYTIGGVIEKPEYSILDLAVILRIENSHNYIESRDGRGYASVAPFLLLKEGADPQEVASKITALYKERFADRIEKQRLGLKLSADNPVLVYGLKNIAEIYLDPTIRYGKSSSKLYSYILFCVAVIMILIACINYTAISISLSNARSSEVAIRKVMGSSRKQLVSQFYTESLLMGAVAVIAGYSLLQISLPLFEGLTDKTFELSAADQFMAILLGLAITFFLSLLAGVYPARLMSGLNIVQGIRAKNTYKIKPGLIQGMVVFQFTLCIFFLALGLSMHKQFAYINSRDLGFERDQVVYLSRTWGISDQLKQELDKEPSIISSVGAGGIFGSGGSLGNIVSKGVEHTMRKVFINYGFFETMGMELVSGRTFDPTRNKEQEVQYYVVNETYYQLYKADTLLSKGLEKVIGVVKDFHFESLNQEIGPVRFLLSDPRFISVMYAKLDKNNIEEGMAAMQRAWDKVAPEEVMSLKFLDEYLASQYKDTQRWGRIIDVSAILAILIACSGLFGLTAINAMNRTKEIGIRKVLGADFPSLLVLLNKQNIWLILISMLIALPLWYYTVNTWVGEFAYRTTIGFDLFALAGILCLLMVLVTASFHSFRTSRINPTTLLRSE